MDRRTLLKIMGGIAALPALGKAIKGAGIKATKVAGKVLPKVQGRSGEEAQGLDRQSF